MGKQKTKNKKTIKKGKDATEAFDDIGHSDAALDDLKQYYIGDLQD